MRYLKSSWIYMGICVSLATILGFVIGILTSRRQAPLFNENSIGNQILSEINELKTSQHIIQKAVTKNPKITKIMFYFGLGMMFLGALIATCIAIKTQSPLDIFLTLFSGSLLGIGGSLYAQSLIDKR